MTTPAYEPRAVHLTGGLHHPAQATSAFWQSFWRDSGVETETFEDIDEGCAHLAHQRHDLLVVSALRWPMDNDEKYAPHRARWACRLGDSARAAIAGHLQAGGALLALHTASISFGDWPAWRDILGARWVWGRSWHPPHGPTRTQVVDHRHPVTRGVPDFDAPDEVYSDLEMQPGVRVLAHSRAGEGAWWPTWWVHRRAGAKVCVDLLGHNEQSLGMDAHRRALRQAVDWLLDRGPQDDDD